MRLNSLNVGVRDMQRALGFYRLLFGADPVHIEAWYALFDVGAVSFGVWSSTHDSDELLFGNTCVPSFQVEDIDAEYRRIQRIAPHIDDQIRSIGTYRSFKFVDTEGNLVELYSVPEL